ncbi:MAG TPA: hypothetical protein GX002_07140 [Clostridiales bacterium]|nr:hypothetical protein [Clostridiales bacterium]
MSCHDFRNCRRNIRGRFDPFDGRFDDRRCCFHVNWGSCTGSRFCHRRHPFRQKFRWPY